MGWSCPLMRGRQDASHDPTRGSGLQGSGSGGRVERRFRRLGMPAHPHASAIAMRCRVFLFGKT
eukprot:11212696-Lingulodinium_polyedra.AAC.1